MNRHRKLPFLLIIIILAFGCTLPGFGAPSRPNNPDTPSTSAPTALVAATPTENLVILPHTTVDPSTMTGKLLMGYQGWFACPGDGSKLYGYFQWIKDGFTTINAESYREEMWPDTSELSDSEKCQTDLKYPDGSPAYLYSAANYQTVLRHFQWMSEYGIDGVFLQRFAGQLNYPYYLDFRNHVTGEVRDASDAYGRVWAIMYDVSGVNENFVDIVQALEDDWKFLVDEMKVTDSPTYLHHNGLPVLAIWGFGFDDSTSTPEQAQQLVDLFENNPDPRYRVTLMGGVPIWWRTLQSPSKTDPAWADYYCSLDIISPWTVGYTAQDSDVDAYYSNEVMADRTRAQECGAEYMPVVFPGHAYHNPDPSRPFNEYPRRGGRLYWRQVYDAVSGGSNMIYNAMFDEVDEGTAMYKIAATNSNVPVGLQVITMDTDGECLPSDWYLRLAGEATKMLRGESPLSESIPILAPPPADPGACQETARIRLKLVTTSDWTTVSLEGVPINNLQIVSSSQEAADAAFERDLNRLVLTQPIEQANAGQSIEMVVDLVTASLVDATLNVTVGRGNLGATSVEIYAFRELVPILVKTLEWSGLTDDGQNLQTFEVPGLLFGAAP